MNVRQMAHRLQREPPHSPYPHPHQSPTTILATWFIILCMLNIDSMNKHIVNGILSSKSFQLSCFFLLQFCTLQNSHRQSTTTSVCQHSKRYSQLFNHHRKCFRHWTYCLIFDVVQNALNITWKHIRFAWPAAAWLSGISISHHNVAYWSVVSVDMQTLSDRSAKQQCQNISLHSCVFAQWK